jgi:type I restriction enzyme, S subunit
MKRKLPRGWAWAQLQAVCLKIQDGTHFSPKEQHAVGPFRYITAKNIRVSGIDLSNITYISEPAHRAIYRRCNPEKGDVLYIKDGATTGIATLNDLDEEFSLLSSVALLKPVRGVLDSHYLKWYLNSPEGFKAMTDQMTGSAITRLVLKTIRQSPIPVAPFTEQETIAAKLDVLLDRLSASRERMERTSLLIKRFRQSVLAAACSGRLTADWRIQRNDTSAPEETNAVPDDLPRGWKTQRLDSMFEVKSGGTPSRKVKAYFENGTIPWVKTGEVQNCDIGISEEFITEKAVNDSNAKVFPAGTILIAMYGEGKTRGQIGRLLFPSATNQACAALVNPDLHPATNEYIFFCLLGQYYALRAESVGGNQPNLNLGVIKQWQIPLPPLAERVEIVRQVKGFLAIADKIAARYKIVQQQVDRLPQSILAKAFRGELVPAEAELAERDGRTYESAEQLLERIRITKVEGTTERGNGHRRGRQTTR